MEPTQTIDSVDVVEPVVEVVIEKTADGQIKETKTTTIPAQVNVEVTIKDKDSYIEDYDTEIENLKVGIQNNLDLSVSEPQKYLDQAAYLQKQVDSLEQRKKEALK